MTISLPSRTEKINDGAFGVPIGVRPDTMSGTAFSSSFWLTTSTFRCSLSKRPAACAIYGGKRPMLGTPMPILIGSIRIYSLDKCFLLHLSMMEPSTNSFGSRGVTAFSQTDLIADLSVVAMLSRAMGDIAFYILSDGGVGNCRAAFVLGPLHDDIAANQCHDRPAGDLPAFVDRPRRYRVEKLLGDFGAPFQIHD